MLVPMGAGEPGWAGAGESAVHTFLFTDVERSTRRWMADPEGMSRMLELAFKLKQFASGMPSEIKEVKNTLTATIDVEWEVAIRKAVAAGAGRDN